MVLDTARNQAYEEAIKKSVDSGSIVLDLGAGMGIHGLTAASCGAGKVYLLEPDLVLDLSEKVARQNNLSDNIVYIRSTVEESDIPEPVDIIISVFTGNFLLEEDLLPSLFFARDKYLRQGGELIPSRAKMEAVPVAADGYYNERISAWSENDQKINFDLARQFAANLVYFDHFQEGDYRYLAEPVELVELDFMTATRAECRSTREVTLSQDDICHGWLGWFQVLLGDKWLSTSPDAPRTHWRQAFLPLDPPMAVKAGEKMTLHLLRPEFGEWSWTVSTGTEKQQHSTFLSRPVSSSDLQKKSDENKPSLSGRGEAALHVLRAFDGQRSTIDIAREIQEAYPRLFPDLQNARRFVVRLVERFT